MISFIITHKNEKYLEKTIFDLKRNAGGIVEVIHEEDDGRGQRAMLNKLCKQARYDIVAKIDAHCRVGPDFDLHLLKDFKENMIIAPLLYPLDGHTWTINHHNRMGKFGFNTQMAVDHLQGDGESMCMQGSFFMMTKKNWFDWNVCDETIGSWGHHGTELGIKAFLNNGVCYISDKTYYAHVFRHSDEDFPYERDHNAIEATHENFISRFKNKSIVPLIEKFNYPLDWTTEDCAILK